MPVRQRGLLLRPAFLFQATCLARGLENSLIERIAAERTASTILSIVSFSLQEGITIEIFTFSTSCAELCRGDWSYPFAQFAGEKEQLCLPRRFDIPRQD